MITKHLTLAACPMVLSIGSMAFGNVKALEQGPSPDKEFPPRALAGAPNIVFILADDLAWADVGYHGSVIPTPHLDQLASEGVRIDRHYASPVCSPSRAGLMTGRYWSRFGITTAGSAACLPDGTPTIASVLKAAGYRTAIMGKWHLGGARMPGKWPSHFGFDHSYGLLDGHAHAFTHVYTAGGMGGDDGKGGQTWHRNGNFIKEEGHVTDLITRESIQWIESNKDKPFFLYVPYTAPHEKCLDTPEWIAKCAHIPEKLREYAAMVAHMDAGIGQIVETLDRLGLRENTLIVFSSDNGGRPAKPFRGAKGTVWEGGVRVVALANWPTKLGKGILTNPVCIVDWMPTFCALAKIPAPDLLDGRDIWPLLSQPEVPSEARPLYLLGREPSKQAALVYGDWKLVRMPTGDEIYNVTEDLAEGRNLATEEPNRMKQMQELLHETAVRDGDAVAAIIDKQRQPGTSE